MLRWVLWATLPLFAAQVRTVVEVSGVVVDERGKPIPDVHLAYTSINFKTRADGTFRLSTSSPFIVFRHPQFATVVRRSAELNNGRIQMSADLVRPFPACKGHRFDKPIELASQVFRLPYTPGVIRLKQSFDADYSLRAYRLESNRSAFMRHGIGTLWSLGFPVDTDVSVSAEYSEVVLLAGRVRITDARGTTADGKRWRFLGRLTESISYGPLPPHEAEIFDRALDRVCGVN